MTDEIGIIRAAGGVVWRPSAVDGLEIVLVHRPKYDDWSLPKGKLEPGEHRLAAAVREVEEETGIRAVPQVPLPGVTYLTGEPGVRKVVEYWSMRVQAQRHREPDREVSDVRWVPVAQAADLLTYAHDRGVLAAFTKLPPVTAELLLVRHASAGSRRAFTGPDSARPLDETGHAQVAGLTTVLALFAPGRIVSASPLRCLESVAPLAAALRLTVQVDPRFDEDAPGGPAEAAEATRSLARDGLTTVVCSQGKVIPPLLGALAPAGTPVPARFETPKGSGWLLAFADGEVVAADPLAP